MDTVDSTKHKKPFGGRTESVPLIDSMWGRNGDERGAEGKVGSSNMMDWIRAHRRISGVWTVPCYGPEVVGAAEDESGPRVAGGDGIVEWRLTDGAAETADMPVPLHGVQQEPVGDRTSAAAARRPPIGRLRSRRAAVAVPRNSASDVRLRRGPLAHRGVCSNTQTVPDLRFVNTGCGAIRCKRTFRHSSYKPTSYFSMLP